MMVSVVFAAAAVAAQQVIGDAVLQWGRGWLWVDMQVGAWSPMHSLHY